MKLANRVGSRRLRAGVAVAALALVAAACQPGWVNPLVGTGDGSGTTPGSTGVANDGVSLQQPTSVVAIPGGGYYVYDAGACAIYKEAGDGTTSLYAGTPGMCGNSGDGGPATEAQIQAPGGAPNVLALGGDGTLYLTGSALTDGRRGLRTVTTDGTIETILFPEDSFSYGFVSVSPDGTVYASDVAEASKILRLEAGGSWTTVYTASGSLRLIVGLVAESSTEVVFGETDPWSSSSVPYLRLDTTTGVTTPTGVAVASPFDSVGAAGGPDGAIYLGASSTGDYPGSITANGVTYTNQVVRLDPDGTVTPIAGTGNPDPGTQRQQGDALDLDLSPTGLSVTPNGGLLISSGHVIYRLDKPALAGPTSTVPATTSTAPPPIETTVPPPIPTTAPAT